MYRFFHFLICCSTVSEVCVLCACAPFHFRYAKVTVPTKVLNEMFPGAVTTIFSRQPSLNADLNPGCDLVGVRIPKYPPIVQLVEVCGGPLALTSANLSEARSSLEVEVSVD